jgi:lysophospholipase L1-like esterase
MIQKRSLWMLFFVVSFQLLKAQAAYDSSFRFYYYDQKLSMFEQMPTPKKAIVWLGDSITDGGEWSELFPQYNTMNRGISSDNTFGVLNRLYEVVKRKPRKVFLLIGINDIARGVPDEVILRNYRKMIDRIQLQSPATKIYVQSLLPTNNNFTQFKNHQNKTEHVLKVNEGLKKLCTEKKITYINLYDAFLNSEGKLHEKYTNDGLHLTGEGYLRWKEVLIQAKVM